jgi:hypothetical protein
MKLFVVYVVSTGKGTELECTDILYRFQIAVLIHFKINLDHQ